jgi:hypothetical protein
VKDEDEVGDDALGREVKDEDDEDDDKIAEIRC